MEWLPTVINYSLQSRIFGLRGHLGIDYVDARCNTAKEFLPLNERESFVVSGLGETDDGRCLFRLAVTLPGQIVLDDIKLRVGLMIGIGSLDFATGIFNGWRSS